MGYTTVMRVLRNMFVGPVVVQPPQVQGSQETRAQEYLRKTIILKQIMSNKARRYRRINAAQNITTVTVSSFLLFVGFYGIDKAATYLSRIYPTTRDEAELLYMLFLFVLFVIGTLHLVFRFPAKQSAVEKAVAALAALGNELEDSLTRGGNLVVWESDSKIDLIRTRYESIAENLPANSDREFLRAKRDLARKESRRPTFVVLPQNLLNTEEQERIVTAISFGSRTIVDVLIALREVDTSLYLGGGLIRNAVWDFLHGYRSPTAVDDVDVIHFNPDNIQKSYDEAIQRRLYGKLPNVKWSVKNQARMHCVNNEPPYNSIENAISHWPETATAFIARLNDQGGIEFIAPYGFDDLLRLLVINTPPFENRTDAIRSRIEKKHWMTIWPRLRTFFIRHQEN